LLDVMFETPGRADVDRVVIDDNVINGANQPRLYTADGVVIDWTPGGKLNSAA